MLAAALAASLAAFAPVVVHDADERYPLAAAGAHAPVARSADTRPAVYARAVPSADGGDWLQYWLFYAGQDQDRGIVRTGRHQGDWELVQYRVDGAGRPREAVYAQHRGGERCGFSTVVTRHGHPVVYVAHGSHASYFRAGTRDRLWPDPNDEADGRGAITVPRVVPISATDPRWMTYPGRWGNARARSWIPGEQDSPPGPAFQDNPRWTDPDAFASAARGCQASCNHVNACDAPERGIALAAAAIPAALLLLLRRRRTAAARGIRPRRRWRGPGGARA
jgi:Vacuolar protein sorting-associated protein 62